MSRYADFWQKLPDWVEYITTDADGWVVGWEHRPETDSAAGCWDGPEGGAFTFSRHRDPTPDWRDSLERRLRPANPTLCPHCGREI
jgi:hypothetical protein